MSSNGSELHVDKFCMFKAMFVYLGKKFLAIKINHYHYVYIILNVNTLHIKPV